MSIGRSERLTGFTDYEILVVDNGSALIADNAPSYFLMQNSSDRVAPWLIADSTPMHPFNKPKLLNIGIEAAKGDVLTFLDADAIVGDRFVKHAVDELLVARLNATKLCYRVRCLPHTCLGHLERDSDGRSDLIDRWFGCYDTYDIPFEAYGDPETGNPRSVSTKLRPVFGNSQFSITREKLGDLRFNEEYCGRGFEDLWMNREIWRRAGEGYDAIAPDNRNGMLHLCRDPSDEREPGWDFTQDPKSGRIERDEYNQANYARYHST